MVVKSENKMEFVCQRVLSQLSEGDYGRGEKLPPERLLAKQHQVSYMTIRRAISQLTEQGYLVRKVGKGTFVRPDVIGKKLRRRLGLLLPAWQSPEVMMFTMHITRLAEAAHWKPRVFTYRSLDDRQVHDALGFCDALVVLPTDGIFPQETVELFRGSSIPTVFIGLPTYGLGLDSVIGEPERDVDLAMDHLEQLGHRRIAFAFQDLGGKPSSGSPGLRQFTSWQQRILKNFDKEAVKRLSIVIEVPAFQSGYKSVYEQTQRCLQENSSNPVTGIIVPISNFWPLVAAVQDRGLKIPEDVSVVAIGERNETEYYRPLPTTVFVNIEEHMQMAWDLITEKLENPDRPARNAIIKPQLIAGQTTGPVKRNGL